MSRYAETVLRAAIRAGAKVLYEQGAIANGLDPSVEPRFEDLPSDVRFSIEQAAMPVVWAGITAIPDQRWTIWYQGFDAAVQVTGIDIDDDNPVADGLNPYPPPDFDTRQI